MADFEETIIDSTKPNAGRVYDYLLGGNHNFAVDRKAAEEVIKIVPFAPDLMKLIRWFLQKSIKVARERGFTRFLDFASGLPTADHIHNNTPEGTKVIYSDIDPVTVEYGRNIIGENPLVKYVTCDAGTPEILLESDIVKSLFGDNHKTAIGFTGICWFLPDEQVSHAMNVLYEWADPGSILFTSDMNHEKMTKDAQAVMDLYKNMNQPFFLRTREKFIELAKPWQVEEPGLLLLEDWYSLEPETTKKTAKLGGTLFSGFFKK